jgi:hypothetical protein
MLLLLPASHLKVRCGVGRPLLVALRFDHLISSNDVQLRVATLEKLGIYYMKFPLSLGGDVPL